MLRSIICKIIRKKKNENENKREITETKNGKERKWKNFKK